MTVSAPTGFLFGANTPSGFFGYHATDLYDPRDGWAAFLIKSGAGTGKATFMREILAEVTALGVEAEALPCSSDPDSLDAVVFPALRVCILDATAPHILEPVAYGECEQLVPFGCCLRSDITLHQTDAWYEASDACAASHARCCRFLAAAESLLENNARLAAKDLLTDKLDATARRLAAREGGKPQAVAGQETRRFFYAVTPKGALFCADSAATLCPRLYILEDEFGAVAPRFTEIVRDTLLQAGHNVITGFDCLRPQTPLHVLCPTLGVGFLTADSRHPVDFPVYRRVHAARFMPHDALRARRQQLAFNRRAAAELLDEAIAASADAKAHHDRMEALHIAAMDWNLWRDIADRAKADLLAIVRERAQIG